MADLETVEDSTPILDPLIRQQKEDAARMRASLLACSADSTLTSSAVRNITVLRVYHQISRIIRYTEMMDKLEDKLYACLDVAIDRANPNSASTWMVLLNIQERLQKTMIESHKLLQPYLDIQEYSFTDLTQANQPPEEMLIMDKNARDKLRDSARQVLAALEASSEASDGDK